MVAREPMRVIYQELIHLSYILKYVIDRSLKDTMKFSFKYNDVFLHDSAKFLIP